MSQDNTQSVSRSATLFLSGTFLSRCTGLLRDISMAFCFGAHPAVAAFMVAFRFANLFRRLFGEGALPSSFIPHFESLRADSEEKGAQFFRELFFSLALFLLGLVIFVEISLGGLCKAGLFTADIEEIIFLTMLMLPGVIFICLFGLTSALLQCEKKFFRSALAPIAFNAVWIAAVWLFKNLSPQQAMQGLSFAVIAAFFMQWIFTMPGKWGFLFEGMKKIKLFSPEIRSMARPMLLTIFGVSAVQINSALDGLFAHFTSPEGPAYLWYAIRIEQLPLALFGIALSSALLPSLSRTLVSREENEHYKGLLQFAFVRSFALMMPSTLALFVLGCAGVNLLYGRGDFSEIATKETVLCLWGYGAGLIPSVFVLLLAPAFYARKDFKSPMIASAYAVLFNIVLNGVFVFILNWGAFSISLATSLSAFFNCYYLSRRLKREVGGLCGPGIFFSFSKIALATLGAAAVTFYIGYLLQDPTLRILLGQRLGFERQFAQQLIHFLSLGSCFGTIFFALAKGFNIQEVLKLFKIK